MEVVSKPLLRFSATPYKVIYNDDGSIDALCKLPGKANEIPTSELLNDSIYLIKISQRIAQKLKKEITVDTILKVTGILQATTNTKKIPLILVRPVSLSIDHQAMQIIEAKKNKKLQKGWYKDKELVEINVDDIIMTSLEHLKCQSLNMHSSFLEAQEKKKFDLPVAVRQMDNGKYELISGIRSFVTCKVMDIKNIQAHITKMSHEEFIEAHEDVLFNNKRNNFKKKK